MRTLVRSGLALCALLLGGVEARGDTIVLEPVLDTFIHALNTTNSSGQGPVIFSGATNTLGGFQRALLAFDVAGSVPTGATIQGVTLTLTADRGGVLGTTTYGLHRLTTAWREGASAAIPVPGLGGGGGGGAPAQLGDATWNASFFDPAGTSTILWGTAGGDFLAGVSGAAGIASVPSPLSFSSAGMIADVQHWLNTPAEDFGWILIGEEATPSSSHRFQSRESTTPAERPLLEIQFVPEPGASLGAGGALLTLAALSRRRPTKIASWSSNRENAVRMKQGRSSPESLSAEGS